MEFYSFYETFMMEDPMKVDDFLGFSILGTAHKSRRGKMVMTTP